jgi:hypothetical protein
MSVVDRHGAGEPQPMDAIVSTTAAETSPVKRPLYPRLLHLQNIHPNAWQRAVLGEGAVGLAGLLVLADLATGWTLIVLPVAVAAVVKGHDLLAGLLSDSDDGAERDAR